MTQQSFNRIFGLFALLIASLLILPDIGLAQRNAKAGLKLGLDFGNYLLNSSGSSPRELGYMAGLFCAIPVFRDSTNPLTVNLELDFAKMVHSRPQQTFYPVYGNIRYRVVQDVRTVISIVELGLLPSFVYSPSRHESIAVYLGPSVGLGRDLLKSSLFSRTPVDTLKFTVWDAGETANRITLTGSINLGFSWTCNRLVVDMRYKYTFVNGDPGLTEFDGAYICLGWILG